MNIFYYPGQYISFRITAADNIRCLESLGHCVTTNPEAGRLADLAIIHDDASLLPKAFSAMPWLHSMRSIAYAVWENAELSPIYREALKLVDEIWTPSEFSRQSMLPYFSAVSIVPHVVRRKKISSKEINAAKALVQPDDRFLFFSIVDSINPRKNLPALLRVFLKVRQQCKKPVRLVVKQYRQSLSLESLPDVLSIDDSLTDGQMAALHVLSDAYISTHHAEGWGLGLSDAMAYGKPVLATGYSGNMQFMNKTNSFPIDYTLENIPEGTLLRTPFLTSGMQWAAIDENVLADTMVKVMREDYPRDLPQNAAAICRSFSTSQVAGIMQRLIG